MIEDKFLRLVCGSTDYNQPLCLETSWEHLKNKQIFFKMLDAHSKSRRGQIEDSPKCWSQFTQTTIFYYTTFLIMNFYLVKQGKKGVFGFCLNRAESMTIDNCTSHSSSKILYLHWSENITVIHRWSKWKEQVYNANQCI